MEIDFWSKHSRNGFEFSGLPRDFQGKIILVEGTTNQNTSRKILGIIIDELKVIWIRIALEKNRVSRVDIKLGCFTLLYSD